MAIDTRISYVYIDPLNFILEWQGYTEDFDSAVISIADKIAEQYDLRTVNKSENYFLDTSLMITSLSGGVDANGIFDVINDGNTPPPNFNVLLDSQFTFKTDGLLGRLVVSDGADVGLGNFNVFADNGNGTLLQGLNSGASEYALKIRNGLGLDLSRFRNSGRVDLAANGAQVYMGNQSGNYALQSLNSLKQFSNTATYSGIHADRNGNGISMRGSTVTRQLISSTGTMVFQTDWNNNINSAATYAGHITAGTQLWGFGLANELIAPLARIHSRGAGNDILSKSIMATNTDDVENFSVTDNGDIAIPNVRVYLDIVTAQADATLPIGALYRTTVGGPPADSVIRIKV